jgi:PPOX class probable F420-dependent enzyme
VIRLTPDQVRLLNAPYFATVATLMPDGSPEATVVWIDSDAEHVYFNTAMHRLKARNLQRDPRIAITVIDPANPYGDALAIRGRAELITEGAHEHAHKLSHAYDGKPFRHLEPGEVRVMVRVTPERVHVQKASARPEHVRDAAPR